MELPFAACGPVPPPPTPSVNACPDITKDTDGDGLPDCWEDGQYWSDGLPGIALDGVYISGQTPTNRFTLCVDANKNGVIEPNLKECASKTERDIFVEIDYMTFHQPNQDAVNDVVNGVLVNGVRVGGFANAPSFTAGSGKCDASGGGCTPGIRLHVLIDEQLPHVTNTALIQCTGS